MKLQTIFLLLLACFLALLVVQSFIGRSDANTLDYTNEQVVTEGREIYARECASCHGVDLQGQPNWKVRKSNGRLPAPPHNAQGHTWHHSEQVLIRMTKKGIGGPDYQTDMPAYEGKLSDREIIAVLSYIKSTWPQSIQQRHDMISRQQQ